MKIDRVPSVPLITCDPYFSLWSPADTLTGADTCHWAGAVKRTQGVATVDGTAYRFLGLGEEPALVQRSLDLTPTASRYAFEGAGISLTVDFTTPLLLEDLDLVSRPCSYLDFTVRSLDGAEHTVDIRITFDEGHCYDGEKQPAMIGGVHACGFGEAGWLSQKQQGPLSHSGDGVSIDWGTLYLAVPSGMGTAAYEEGERCGLSASLSLRAGSGEQSAFLVAAYDDIASIMYFESACRGYWARDGKTILTAIEEAVGDHRTLRARCAAFDEELLARARETAGEDYALVCALAYRQSIAAHKLIAGPDGEAVFLSKECFSNGCIGTVDVSYPSVPLFLLYNPELVKGMLRPIFRFARMPVWPYDFAPHDVGRYPYATGQVYGLLTGRSREYGQGGVFPPFYQYPAGSQVYTLDRQMPVEECGNMLILCAAVAVCEGDAEFARPQMDLLEKWAVYLLEFGADPGEQLCTDDFAGHLAHNINLSAKAIMGIEAYALLLDKLGRAQEARAYRRKAACMARDWEDRAQSGDHTALTFGDRQGWSLKYNLVWDRLFGSGLFAPETYRQETAWYRKQCNAYGVPLDSRKDYTKSDWILWCCAMTDSREEMESLIRPIARFLKEAPDRVPFSDWFDTKTAKQIGFQNRTVQGGLFMPLLREEWARNEQ
ncbi:MAG: DUF4965 domain-containing protein [Provencibacterium sp.]|jgi:hypothetical protein|nr:DUF4965 domain-containing protein [Provencibacterium sp.]